MHPGIQLWLCMLLVLHSQISLPPCRLCHPPRRCRRLQIVRTGGWGALFSGLEASLIGTTVSQGIYFYL